MLSLVSLSGILLFLTRFTQNQTVKMCFHNFIHLKYPVNEG